MSTEDLSGTYTSPVQATSPGGFFRPKILNRILLILGFIGIFDASLLSAEVLLKLNLNCGADGGCATVASDPSAFWFGIPVAYFGLCAYLTFTALAAIRGIYGVENTKRLTYVGYGMAGFGAIVSIYLQYVALVKIGAFCPYCFGSAVNMILTLVLYALLASKLGALRPAVAEAEPTQTHSVDGSGDGSWVGVGALATVVAVVLGTAILQTTHKAAQVVTKGHDMSRLAPVQNDVHSYGDPKSPIKITEFADLACIHCQELTPKLHDFIDKYPGKIWSIYRHFPLMKPHPMAVTAALVSEYAARKGKFWDYADAVFRTNAEPKTWDDVAAPAKALGLDLADIQAEITKPDSPELDVVTKDSDDASYFGLSTTPTFFIEAPGQNVRVATATDIFDVLTSSPYKEMLASK
jgi:protein-disulfide isomerase